MQAFENLGEACVSCLMQVWNIKAPKPKNWGYTSEFWLTPSLVYPERKESAAIAGRLHRVSV